MPDVVEQIPHVCNKIPTGIPGYYFKPMPEPESYALFT